MCLELLCNDWWYAWKGEEVKAWPIFEQLLLLGTITLSQALSPHLGKANPQDTKSARRSQRPSEERLTAITGFLLALLKPRAKLAKKSTKTKKDTAAPNVDWEWDGVSELPALDTFEAEDEGQFDDENSAMAHVAALQLPSQVYPKSAHRDAMHASSKMRNALAQLIGMTGELASDLTAGIALRTNATRLMCAAAVTWVAGATTVEVADEVITQTLMSDAKVSSDLSVFRHIVGKERAEKMRSDLAPVLPGLVSSLNRILLGKPASSKASTDASKRPNSSPGPVISLALDLLRQALALSLNNAATEMLVMGISAQTRSKSESRESGGNVAEGSSEPARRSFKQTLANVRLVLDSLSPLVEHDSAQVQQSQAALAATLLLECYAAMSLTLIANSEGAPGPVEDNGSKTCALLIRWLADLSSTDSKVETVSKPAQASLNRLLQGQAEQVRGVCAFLRKDFTESLESLPAKIRLQDDVSVSRLCERVSSILRQNITCCLHDEQHTSELHALLCTPGGIQVWTSRLADGISIDTSSPMQEQQSENAVGSTLKITGLTVQSSRALTKMLAGIGASLAELCSHDDFHGQNFKLEPLVIQLLRDAERFHCATPASLRRSLSSLLLAERILAGVSSVLSHERTAKLRLARRKKIQRLTARLCKEATSLAVDLLSADPADEGLNQMPPQDDMSGKQVLDQAATPRFADAQHQKGLPSTIAAEVSQSVSEYARSSPLDLDFVSAATVGKQRPNDVSKHEDVQGMLRCCGMLANDVIGHLSALQGPAYSGAMMHVLYPVVLGLASVDEQLRDSSSMTLARISQSIGYTDVRRFVWENADYIMGRAVHALRSGVPAGPVDLESEAELVASQAGPLVMVQLMKLLGPEAVVLLHDAVDELLDALDKFHGFARYTTGLLSVLTGVVQVVAANDASIPQEHTIKPKPRLSREHRLRKLRAVLAGSTSDEAFDDPNLGEEASEIDVEPKEDEKEAKLAQVVTEVMERATPFVSHPSPYLRAQALQLLSQGSIALASRGKFDKLMPVVNRAFPFMLARIGGRQSQVHQDEVDIAVQVEALDLLATWAQTVPDFLSRRLNEEAWPRLRTLLSSLLPKSSQLDGKAGLKSIMKVQHNTRGSGRTFLLALTNALANLVSGTKHRMASSAIWDICTHPLLIFALQTGVAPEVRAPVLSLFSELAKVNGGAVWASVNAAGGCWSQRQGGCLALDTKVDIVSSITEIFDGKA